MLSTSDTDLLAPVKAFDRLEVGPVQVERHRLVCPYRVVNGDSSEVTELTYKYEEPVFDPNDDGDRNLAAVIAAQVALNYGLFGDEIIFHGPFDGADRKLLRDMAKNTAREIYVNKLLTANPFLQDPARDLPVVNRKSYLRANLSFPDSRPGFKGKQAWESYEGSSAVLSSGGKESLLTYALLDEIGQEVHPIFVNESGRHWFTALNAYRHFSAHVPNTARVWTNSDRVFTWMLRRLPFVRPDFASLRSDAYPIRLWTVAVFVFGALPLLKKRGVGQLVIGDEYDTTVRAVYHGISHYAGLYDQSLFFDTALSRYFHNKAWPVLQFSILRPFSELLVEKILTERFPKLQRFQVSCHAAHKEGESVRPCGACEKCRRVVGMLSALGADPTHCGYTPAQVDRCLKDFIARGVHLEAEAEKQTLFLLEQRGLIEKLPQAKPDSEVLKLRFNPARSPIEGIPKELRRPLYSIYLQHAQGSVQKVGRVWRETNLLTNPALERPQAFEAPPRDESHQDPGPLSYKLGELTWPQAEARAADIDLALLPVGAVEQHGHHLPLDTDAYDAEYLTDCVARACSDPKPIVLPPIPYGVSYHHQDFPGTVSISPDTLSRLVYEVGMSVARWGITKLIIINGHGGNIPALNFSAQMINRDAHIFTCVESGESSDSDVAAIIETANDVHAGEIETSTSLAVRPELVRLDQASPSVPQFSSRFLNFTSRRSVPWYAHTVRISSTGVMGDPTKASRDKGLRIWELMIGRLVELVEDLKSLTLEEIHHQRY